MGLLQMIETLQETSVNVELNEQEKFAEVYVPGKYLDRH